TSTSTRMQLAPDPSPLLPSRTGSLRASTAVSACSRTKPSAAICRRSTRRRCEPLRRDGLERVGRERLLHAARALHLGELKRDRHAVDDLVALDAAVEAFLPIIARDALQEVGCGVEPEVDGERSLGRDGDDVEDLVVPLARAVIDKARRKACGIEIAAD